ncbi:MAG: AlpA family phage regulatory protein [Stagnimonas sp.]|nr:AlpA family phage regulatory protein [Stagnimonas sp.]
MSNRQHAAQIIRRRELEQLLQLSRGTLYNKLDPKSQYYDATFPRPIPLGAVSIGWVLSEVNTWVHKQKVASRGGKS